MMISLRSLLAVTLALSLGVATPAGAQTVASTPRRIAITVDDLPVVSATRRDIGFQQQVTEGIVSTFVRHRVPAVGFVNENKLAPDGAVDPRRIALLSQWLDAGLELGNHGYSHLDLHRVPLAEYRVDILRGERVTRALAESAGRPLRWFRHPFLHAGRDLETRRALESFLAEHGYAVAPVTVDNYDYLFAAAYDRAAGAPDADSVRQRIAAEYLGYMERVVAFYEQQSTTLLGREIPHVLLLHANALNAETLDRLLAMLARRGYEFAPLDEVVRDPAYASKDEYTGPAGITWLHRWALTAGRRGADFAGEPEVPAWIERAAAAR